MSSDVLYTERCHEISREICEFLRVTIAVHCILDRTLTTARINYVFYGMNRMSLQGDVSAIEW